MVIVDGYYSDADYYSWQSKGPERYMLAHSRGVEYAPFVTDLDFSAVDVFRVWSVYADFGRRQACIAIVKPLPFNVPDTVYAFGVEKQAIGYVDGAAFVPGVIRARLTDFAIEGEYDVYSWNLPCVTVSPVEALTRPGSEMSLA